MLLLLKIILFMKERKYSFMKQLTRVKPGESERKPSKPDPESWNMNPTPPDFASPTPLVNPYKYSYTTSYSATTTRSTITRY